jgi:hypothetical protein
MITSFIVHDVVWQGEKLLGRALYECRTIHPEQRLADESAFPDTTPVVSAEIILDERFGLVSPSKI